MDYITCFDIYLEKDVYYPGETISGCVLLENCKALKVKGIRCFLRGRTKVHWKVLKSGETRVLKDDQYLIDEKCTIFGQGKDNQEDIVEILPPGTHQFNFNFALPSGRQMPCSLETKNGTVRYYVKVLIDIAYASAPQGIKYFTFIGPHIDCMEEKYLSSLCGQDHKVQCLRCCHRGTVALRITLERTAYCCNENIKLRAHVENRQDMTICLCIRLFQHIDYRIERSSTEIKSTVSTVMEYRTPIIQDNSNAKFDSLKLEPAIQIPVVPPTMIGVCRLIQIYYILKISIEDERKNETLEMDFPFTIATIPHRCAQSQLYTVDYDFCVDYVETGKYISPEFRLGTVYDGSANKKSLYCETPDQNNEDEIILYRPVYVKTIEPSLVASSKKLGAGKSPLDSLISGSSTSFRVDHSIATSLGNNGAEENQKLKI